MLYSVSSTVKDPPVSGVPSVVPVEPSSNPAFAPVLNDCRTAFNLSRSDVKSWFTVMVFASDTTDTRSAGCICLVR